MKNTKNSEKFKLKRTQSRSIEKNLGKEFIEREELKNPEALRILKNNKRRFGEGFRSKDDKVAFKSGKLTGHASAIKIEVKGKNVEIGRKDKGKTNESKGQSKFSWL